MAVYFFENELLELQTRFNDTFGESLTCHLKLRQAVLITIIWLGVSAKKISRALNQDSVRSEIKEFVRTRDALNGLFNQMQSRSPERREHGAARDLDRKGGELPELREHLSAGASQAG